MGESRIRLRSLPLFALTLLLATSALAWVQSRSSGGSTPLLIRPGGEFDFSYEMDGAEIIGTGAHTALDAARATLNSVLTSDATAGRIADFDIPGAIDDDAPAGITLDSNNRVFFFTTDANSDFPDTALALSMVWHNTSTGAISECDIAFNDHNFNWNTASPDLEGVALGQFLECFGLARSPVAGNFNSSGHEIHGLFNLDFAQQATLYPEHSNTDAERTLHSDDVAALSTLYPNAMATASFGEITGAVTTSGGSGVKGAHVVAVSTSSPNLPVVGYLAHIDDTSVGTPGFYRLTGLPPDDYYVRVEPLTGLPNSFLASHIGESGFATAFPPEFWSGGAESAADAMPGPADAVATTVTAGATASGRNIVINTVGGLAGDNFADRIAMSQSFTAALTTTSATTEGTDPNPPAMCSTLLDPSNKKSVWFTFTAPRDGNIVFSTAGSNYDTVVMAVTGTPGAFSFIDCNDDIAGLFTPAFNQQSEVSFSVLKDDERHFGVYAFSGNGGTLVVNFTFTRSNLAPVAVPDSYATGENTTLVVNAAGGLLANDTDADPEDSGFLMVDLASVVLPALGSLSVNADGSFTFVPDHDFLADGEMHDQSFSYRAIDTLAALSNAATVTLTITGVNDPPAAGAQSLTTNEDAALPITLTGTDLDISDTLEFSISSGPTSGMLSAITPLDTRSASVTYTPGADFNGMDSFDFEVDDGIGGTDIATVTITVNPVNDPPSFTGGPSDTVDEDSGPRTVPGWATNLSPGPADEAGQTLTFNVSANTNSALFSAQPAVSSTGTLTYTPAADAHGSADITLVLMDDGGTASGGADTSAPQMFTLTVSPVNDAPVNSVPGAQTTNEDTPLVFSSGSANPISIADLDAGSSPIKVTLSVTNGTLTLGATTGLDFSVGTCPGALGDGTADAAMTFCATRTDANAALQGLTYSPAANFNGNSALTLTSDDQGNTGSGGPLSDTDVVNITVNPVNDLPLADAQSPTTTEDTALPITLTGSDVDADSLTFSIVTPPANGMLSVVTPINATSASVTYTPNADYNGPDSFVFQVDDGAGGTDTATVSLTVTAVNDPPSFTHAGNVNRMEDDGAVTIAPWASNISPGPADEAGQTLQFHLAGNTNPALFTLPPAVSASTGNLTFTLAPNANGSAAITVALMDDGGTANGGSDTSAPAMFTINVAAINDPPGFTGGPNDTVDEDSGPRTLAGWATNLSPGPADEADQTLTFNVSAITNSALFSAQPAVSSTGTLTYTPAADAHGSADITLVLMDNGGTANGGSDTSAPYTFTLTVTPVNDPPVAVSQTVTADEDTPVMITLTGSDADADALSFSVTTGPANGALAMIGAPLCAATTCSAPVTYTPDLNFNGMDSFVFEVCDAAPLCNAATVTLIIAAVNDAPVADSQMVTTDEDAPVMITLTGSDADADPLTFSVTLPPTNGSLSGTEPNLTYTPDLNFHGMDSLEFQICDPAPLCDIATVNITVNPLNDPPVAMDDNFVTLKNTELVVPAPGVLANDTDVDGGPLLVTSTTMMATSQGGTAQVNANGGFSYTPPVDFEGDDTFNYSISDGLGGTDSATVTLHLVPNLPPNAGNDMATTLEDTAVDVNVLANDTDSDGPNPLSLSAFSQGANGAVSNQGGGVLRYSPAADFNGMDSFTYDVTDGVNTVTATVTLTVTPVNDPPSFAGGPDQTVAEDSGPQSVLNWAANLSPGPADEAGQALSFNLTANTNAALFSAQPAVSSTGTLSYTPAPDAFGAADITLVLMDDGGTANGGADTSAPYTFTLTVTPVNDPPVANAGPDQSVNATALSGMTATASVMLNGSGSSDPDGDSLTFLWREGATEIATGATPTVTLAAGVHTLTLEVSDGTVTVTDEVMVTVVDYALAAQCQGGSPPCNSPTMATLNDGQFVDFAVTATGVNGTYSSSITVSCQNLPALTTCTFTPSNTFANAPPGGSTLTVRIQTTAAGIARLQAPGAPRRSLPPLYALWMGLPGLALFGVALAGGRARRRGLGTLCLLALVLMMGMMLVACGGGGDAIAPRPRAGTPPGSYNIAIRTTAAGTLEHTVNLTVVVQ